MIPTTIESAPAFVLPEMTPEALGELFIETAQMILANSGGITQGKAIEGCIRMSAAFCEAVSELQSSQ